MTVFELDLPRYATHDLTIEKSHRADLEKLDLDGLNNILRLRKVVLESYETHNWFPHIIAKSKADVKEIEGIIAGKQAAS